MLWTLTPNLVLPSFEIGGIKGKLFSSAYLLRCVRRKEWHYLSFRMPTYYSTRDHFGEPPSLLHRVIAGLPSGLAAQIQRLWNGHIGSMSVHESRIPRSLRNGRGWNPRRLLNLPHLFVVVWLVLLLWGERWVFERAVQACEWERWERWVSPLRRNDGE